MSSLDDSVKTNHKEDCCLFANVAMSRHADLLTDKGKGNVLSAIDDHAPTCHYLQHN